METKILKTLRQKREARFTDLFKELKGSKTTLSQALKVLQRQGLVRRDLDTRKYMLTTEGEERLETAVITDRLLSIPRRFMYAVERAYWREPLEKIAEATFFIEGEEEGYSHNALLVAYKRLERQKDDILGTWMENIHEAIEEHGDFLHLTNESPIEEMWKVLFKGVKRIIVVETLNPSLLLEKLAKGLPPITDKARLFKALVKRAKET